MKKNIFVILPVLLIATCGILIYKKQNNEQKQSYPMPAPAETPAIVTNGNSTQSDISQNESKKSDFPESYDLKVAFVSQAPFANWDELHDEACEEAVIILVHYFKQKKTLTKEIAEDQIQKMVAYEIKNYGSHKDLTAAETAKLAKDFYGYKNVTVKYDFSWDNVKREIAAGNPVIVPTAGKLLGNPNFRSPGPVYHMLVIRGYTKNIVITNDIGTRKGERYQYSYKTLDKSIHDWTGNPETIAQGRRAMIVIEN